ncbi:MAG: SMI1/KNR4 family protein, partial [Acutalibacteraceae bacterium]
GKVVRKTFSELEELMDNSIVQIIGNLKDMRFIKPASPEEIENAEKSLNLKFADDYTAYISHYGVISARGIELTGITEFERLSVVSVTKREKELNSNILSNMYVIENIAIDGIVIVQDEKGLIYAVTSNNKPRKIFSSLAEYIENSKF